MNDWERARVFGADRPTKRRSSEQACDASYLRGGRCPHAAKHTHRTVEGDTLHLCGVHYQLLLRHERRESAPDLLARWRER